MRGFLTKVVNDTFSRNYRAMSTETDREINHNDFENRLLFCLNNELISFLKRKSTGEVLIMHDVVKEMKAQRINHILSLVQLGRMFQCQVGPVKLGDKTARVITMSIQKFIEFVLPPIS